MIAYLAILASTSDSLRPTPLTPCRTISYAKREATIPTQPIITATSTFGRNCRNWFKTSDTFGIPHTSTDDIRNLNTSFTRSLTSDETTNLMTRIRVPARSFGRYAEITVSQEEKIAAIVSWKRFIRTIVIISYCPARWGNTATIVRLFYLHNGQQRLDLNVENNRTKTQPQ